MEFRYNPSDYPWPLNEDMENVYDAYRNKNSVVIMRFVDDVHFSIKNAWRAGIVTFDEMKNMQGYFWNLLDEFYEMMKAEKALAEYEASGKKSRPIEELWKETGLNEKEVNYNDTD